MIYILHRHPAGSRKWLPLKARDCAPDVVAARINNSPQTGLPSTKIPALTLITYLLGEPFYAELLMERSTNQICL